MQTIIKDIEEGIKVTFKDGSYEWFSPSSGITIDNGYFKYRIEVDEIEKIESYKDE